MDWAFNRLPNVSSYNRKYCSKSTTMQDVMEITKTKLSTNHFLMSIGLLNNNYKCPICNDFMMVQSTSAKGSSDGYIWCCRKTVNKKSIKYIDPYVKTVGLEITT